MHAFMYYMYLYVYNYKYIHNSRYIYIYIYITFMYVDIIRMCNSTYPLVVVLSLVFQSTHTPLEIQF